MLLTSGLVRQCRLPFFCGGKDCSNCVRASLASLRAAKTPGASIVFENAWVLSLVMSGSFPCGCSPPSVHLAMAVIRYCIAFLRQGKVITRIAQRYEAVPLPKTLAWPLHLRSENAAKVTSFGVCQKYVKHGAAITPPPTDLGKGGHVSDHHISPALTILQADVDGDLRTTDRECEHMCTSLTISCDAAEMPQIRQ